MTLYTFDTETHLILPGLVAPPLVCVSAILRPPTYVPSTGPLPELEGGYLLDKYAGADDVERALRDPSVRIVGHNVAFDMAVLGAARPALVPLIFHAYSEGRVSDTGIREKLIQLALGNFSSEFGTTKQKSFSMEEVFKRRFNMDLSGDKKGPDSWRLRYADLEDIPVEQWPVEAREYAIGDATNTYLLWCAQASDTYTGVVDADTGLVTNEQEQAAADFALHLMGAWGVRTNGATVETLAAKLEENSRSVREALTGTIFRAKDGSKDTKYLAALVEAAYATEKLEPPKTPKGAISTAKETLLMAPAAGQPVVNVWMSDELTGVRERRDTPVLQALASISADEHNLKTYIEPLRSGVYAPITARWNVLLETGRTSCYAPINWQNIPKVGGFRECVEPRPGWVIGQADYSTIELCAYAQYCLDTYGHSEMADALRKGRDLHLDLAAQLLDITYEEAVARKKEPLLKKYRQMSKPINFGLPGGMGVDTLIETAKKAYNVVFDEDPEQAKQIVLQYIQKWKARWSESRKHFDMVSRECQQGGGQYTLTQVRSGRVRGGARYCEACNSYFQGLAADGAKMALFCLLMECYTGTSPLWEGEGLSPLMGCRPTLFIHDEILCEMPEEIASVATERMCQVMVAGMSVYIPDVPIKVEPSIMRRWSKKAEEVRDADGKLLVWEESAEA